MPDALTSISTFINSPPGQVAAGAVLAGIVWKFFERVEAVLTDQTKFEIAVWLVGVKVGDKIAGPATFLVMYEKIFGKRHPSLKGFIASAIATACAFVVTLVYMSPSVSKTIFEAIPLSSNFFVKIVLLLIVGGFYVVVRTGMMVLPDYAAVMTLHWAIRGSYRKHSPRFHFVASIVIPLLYSMACIIFADLMAWMVLTSISVGSLIPPSARDWYSPSLSFRVFLWKSLKTANGHDWTESLLTVFPLYLGTIWLWLYATSGFLLKAARQFDMGFQWFNRKFDIEKKPLSAIGLVAGALVALAYWGGVIVARVWK